MGDIDDIIQKEDTKLNEGELQLFEVGKDIKICGDGTQYRGEVIRPLGLAGG